MTIAKHAPPPPGIEPASLWGTEERVRELFGDGVSDLRIEPAVINFRFRSPEHWLEYFRTYFGPMRMAFARVGDDGSAALETDLLELMRARRIGGRRGARRAGGVRRGRRYPGLVEPASAAPTAAVALAPATSSRLGAPGGAAEQEARPPARRSA